MKTETIQDVTQLRDELVGVFKKLQKKEIDNAEAFALAKIANVIIQSSKAQIDYKKLTGDPKKIVFLESE